MAGDLARDHAHERRAVVAREQRDVASLDVLVAGLDPLLRGGQVHPELRAVEEAALRDERVRRALDVLDAGAGRHPLRRAVGDEAAAAGGVLVLEGAIDDVGHGLEAAVRVPGRALRLAGRVFDGADVVEEQERIGQRQFVRREGTADDEALALLLRVGGDDAGDGPPRCLALRAAG